MRTPLTPNAPGPFVILADTGFNSYAPTFTAYASANTAAVPNIRTDYSHISRLYLPLITFCLETYTGRVNMHKTVREGSVRLRLKCERMSVG